MEKVKLLFRGLATNLIFTTVLFICAGRMDYTGGWIFLVVNVLSTIMNYVTILNNSGLMHERSNPGEGIKTWDKLLLGLSALLYLIIIVLAGLDSGRFLWTPESDWVISVFGIILMVAGQFLFLTARNQNNFFSSVVRIQKERGHTVCDTGLYKTVRHPGSLGMMLSLLSLPFITNSAWSCIPTLVAIILLLIRTVLEDKTLRAELNGYEEYTRKTPYKLIPLLW
jgi:protein-S-isoprenylcysteine O-methyltransferase Ste14